jgi:hypothetical protein
MRDLAAHQAQTGGLVRSEMPWYLASQALLPLQTYIKLL